MIYSFIKVIYEESKYNIYCAYLDKVIYDIDIQICFSERRT